MASFSIAMLQLKFQHSIFDQKLDILSTQLPPPQTSAPAASPAETLSCPISSLIIIVVVKRLIMQYYFE